MDGGSVERQIYKFFEARLSYVSYKLGDGFFGRKYMLASVTFKLEFKIMK